MRKKNIWMGQTAYFAPTNREKEDMIHAAVVGVDVAASVAGP